MYRRSAAAIAGCFALILVSWTGVGAQSQLPMAPMSGSGGTVSPAYEAVSYTHLTLPTNREV